MNSYFGEPDQQTKRKRGRPKKEHINCYFEGETQQKKKRTRRPDHERMMMISVGSKHTHLKDLLDQYASRHNLSRSEFIFRLINRYHQEATM